MTPRGQQGDLVGGFIGGYQLVGLLGTGGMAEVYRGRDPQLGREVAVKVLPITLAQDPGYVTRFREEARRVAALAHPNIVPVYRYGEEHGLLYLVMPVLQESLRERMDRERRLEPADAARLTVQIAAALDAAHSQGLVHRDVKPENILLNAEGRAMLTDFGIAREIDVLRDGSALRTLSATGLPVGTPEYMAPEQLRGGAADQRVDVYALGAVLYELLTGHVPHDAETPYEVAAKVLTERALPPSEYSPAIWAELEDVVLGALALDPDDRYPDMRSFAAALRRAVLQRGASTALVTAGAALGSPTPLARTLATRRLDDLRGSSLSAVDNLPTFITQHWEDTAPPKRHKRLPLVMAGVAAVLVLAVCGGLAWGTVEGRLSLGGWLDRSPTATTGGSGLPIGATTPTVSADLTATANSAATPSATLLTTPASTAAPTATPIISPPPPQPTPTNPLKASPTTLTLTQTNEPNTCVATERFTYTGTSTANWTWTPSPAWNQTYGYWTFNGNTAFNTPPQTVSPGTNSVTIQYWGATTCGAAASVTVTVTVPASGATATFTIRY